MVKQQRVFVVCVWPAIMYVSYSCPRQQHLVKTMTRVNEHNPLPKKAVTKNARCKIRLDILPTLVCFLLFMYFLSIVRPIRACHKSNNG